MEILLIGTGGASGWPADGCRCASCMRARSAGLHRRPGQVLVDGLLAFTPEHLTRPETGPSADRAPRVERLPGGFDITGPDGGRLLLAAGPGQVPEPQPGREPYDVALLDLLASPLQLGRLRRAGLVRPRTTVVALYADDRVSSIQEMARRCELWGAIIGQDGQLISTTSVQSGSAPAGAPTMLPGPHRTLVTGGARSGKSAEAELRLAGEPRVTYVAAGPYPGSDAGPGGEQDAEWASRVAVHRARRPPWWETVETLDVAGLLRRHDGPVLIDGIGTWLAAVFDEAGMWAGGQPDEPAVAGDQPADGPGRGAADDREPGAVVQARIDDLVDAWRQTRALVVAVTDQVGSGLVPAFLAGRVFRDQLGWLNQRLAAESEINLLVVAGRVVTLPD